MCERCAELEREVARLERRLEEAFMLDDDAALALARRFDLTRAEGACLYAIYQHRDGLSSTELDAIVPQNFTISNRRDPEFRQPKTIRVHVHRLRRKVGADNLPPSNRWNGFRLSEQGRKMVADALGA